MADYMTIGPALAVGGNKVEMLQTGKILVTNPEGKTKTLTQDEFKKQVVKNADKIQSGEDFEFKKDRKALKITGLVLGAAALVTGVIYRKDIMKFLTKLSKRNKNKNTFAEEKNIRTVFSNERPKQNNYLEEKTARTTLALKEQIIANDANFKIDYIEKLKKNEKGAVHHNKQNMYEKLFNSNVD